MSAPLHSGSRAKTERTAAGATPGGLDEEWLAVEETDRRESREAARERTKLALRIVVPAGVPSSVTLLDLL